MPSKPVPLIPSPYLFIVQHVGRVISINQARLQTAFYLATSIFIMPIRTLLSNPALPSLTGFGGLTECLPWGASSQSALHVSIYNGQTIHVAGIDPSKAWNEYQPIHVLASYKVDLILPSLATPLKSLP